MRALRNQKNQVYQPTASDLASRHRRAVPTRPARRPSGEISNARRSATSRGRRSKAAVVGRLWRAVRFGLAFTLAVGIVAGSAFAYRTFATSSFFTLRNVDLRGDVRAPREELITSLYQNTARGLWWTDLDDLREKLRQHPWVRDAEVVRVLPDTLRVTISEREPYTLARLSNGALVWVDLEGVILVEQGAFKGAAEIDRGLPLLSGLLEAQDEPSREANRKQVGTYQTIVQELEQGQPSLLERVDEIHLDKLDSVDLQITGRRLKVTTTLDHIYDQLRKALAVLDAVDRGDLSALELFKVTDATKLIGGARISYIDTRSPNRVVIGLGS